MLDKLISKTKQDEKTENTSSKRQYARRNNDHCVGIINGQMHPIENWSSGGMLIVADERLFAINQNCVCTLKFKLRDEIIEIDHKANVVRKAPNKIALKFAPLTKKSAGGFQKVIDDYVSQRFAASQVE